MNNVFNYNAVFTTNINEYKKLRGNNLVVGYTFKISNKMVITNLSFDKVYYIYYDNKLIAFKLIAYSMSKEQHLLETPNGLLWINLKYYRVFYTTEHYFEYLEGKNTPIVYVENSTYLHNISDFTICKHYPNGVELRTSYNWNNGLGKPITETSKIFDVLYTKKGFVVYYELYNNNSYHSYQECLQANLDGMEICDFGEEETTIHFQIKTERKPKIHILRFMEE